MRYGIPYLGSKNSIAEWVCGVLPAAKTFIDLFAGGCAITHAAMLAGKWERFVCNDISGAPYIFREAIRGEFDGYATIPDREDFFMSDDLALKLLYSFGNQQSSYLWGEQYERLKVPAERMLAAPSMHERRVYYRQFMKKLTEYVRGVMDETREELKRPHELEGLERLQRLQGLHGLQGLQGLELMVSDYRNVNLPEGATVYADPPYRNTGQYYGEFDFDAFDEWLNSVDVPVYVSEYDAPRGCVCVAERERSDHLAAHTVSNKKEKIFLQERFAERR